MTSVRTMNDEELGDGAIFHHVTGHYPLPVARPGRGGNCVAFSSRLGRTTIWMSGVAPARSSDTSRAGVSWTWRGTRCHARVRQPAAMVRSVRRGGTGDRGCAGADPKLSTVLDELTALIEAGATAAGYTSGVWTGPMIGDLIAQRFGVRYPNHHVPRRSMT